MTDDVRLSTGFPTHRKTKRLRRVLGAEGVLGLIYLWAWAGRERWEGDLSGLSDDDIEDSCGWDGAPGALIAALADPRVRFIDGPEGARVLHDWAEHNPFAAGKGVRIARGKKGAEAKWAKHRAAQAERQEELDLDASSRVGPASSNATSNETPCPPAPAPAPAPTESESGARAPMYAEAAARALSIAGCPDADAGNPVLINAIAGGISADELVALAGTKKGAGKSVAYLVSTCEGRRRDAAARGESPPTPAIDPAVVERDDVRRRIEDRMIEAHHHFRLEAITEQERDERIAEAEEELRNLNKRRDVSQNCNVAVVANPQGEDARRPATGGR